MISIFDRLENCAQSTPDKLLYVFLDGRGNEIERYTYGSFIQRAETVASHLCANPGIQRRDRVLLAYPPGLEMICAFFACIRGGIIPVPVYPPAAHSFQSAIYKMNQIARDCEASAILTSREYQSSLQLNLARRKLNGSQDITFITQLPWINTQQFEQNAGRTGTDPSPILFLQYTSGSTSHPKGVMVTHENILHNFGLVVNHSSPVAVSWLPQYHDMGLIGYYIYSALAGGTTYGFSPMDFGHNPALWLQSISRYRATASSAPNFAFEYCMRPGRISPHVFEQIELSSLEFLMTAAEPVRPDTYTRFLKMFRPYGLKPESFIVAYGLAENTLAVSSQGRTILSIKKNGLAIGKARPTSQVSEIAGARHLISCGRPLPGVNVRIVDPELRVALPDGDVGEIWITGPSKCAGYWNHPDLTTANFRARIVGEPQSDTYLRTGDMGFLHERELYVCGRAKEMIIVRGQNYYPQDIELIVEQATAQIRPGHTVAFEISNDGESALAILIEPRNPNSLPDLLRLGVAVRNQLNLETALIAAVAPRSIPKTSSGKLMRATARQMWTDGQFIVLQQFSRSAPMPQSEQRDAKSGPFELLKTRYNLTGTESYTLIEAGLDSLDLVVFMHEIKELLSDHGAEQLAGQVDIALIQRVSVAELFHLASILQQGVRSVPEIAGVLNCLQRDFRKAERELMRCDCEIAFELPPSTPPPPQVSQDRVLVTGGTGFLGPFLLRSLLLQTSVPIDVLVRAGGHAQGKDRLRKAFHTIGALTPQLLEAFDERVSAVCGDLGQRDLGLPDHVWDRLTEETGTIYHNGALVNYLLNYERMRSVNVDGTNQVLRLALSRRRKTVNYVSTTFIFGWATKETLYESDRNTGMELLDFGYSQSKWVAEQVCFAAAREGVPLRTFRPALVTPSVNGGGYNFDIAIRLLAFMIDHGIGVDTLNQVSFVPADIVADNIVAISNLPGTEGQTFHVTRDDYSNMMDITDIISRMTGREFRLFRLPEFVPEVIRRCRKEDLLYPLLDFLVDSVDNISAMEFKRYDSSNYRCARDASAAGRADASLDDTVAGILRFLTHHGIISLEAVTARF